MNYRDVLEERRKRLYGDSYTGNDNQAQSSEGKNDSFEVLKQRREQIAREQQEARSTRAEQVKKPAEPPVQKQEPPKKGGIQGFVESVSNFLTPKDQKKNINPNDQPINRQRQQMGLLDLDSPQQNAPSAQLTVTNNSIKNAQIQSENFKKSPMAYFMAGAGDVQVGAGNTLTWLGAEGIGKKMAADGMGIQSIAAPDDLGEFEWNMLYNPKFYTMRVTRAVPFTLSLIPAAVLGAAAGVEVAAVAGLGAFGTAVLGSIGAAGLSRPIESALEAGQTFDEQRRKGLSVDEANKSANKAFMGNMSLASLDAVEFATAFAPSPIKGSNRFLKAITKGATFTGGAALEGGEEVGQYAIQQWAKDEEIDLTSPEAKESFATGSLMGTGMQVTGAIYQRMESLTLQIPEAQQKYEEELRKGTPPLTAKKLALDTVAEANPEAVQDAIDSVIEQAIPEGVPDVITQELTKPQVQQQAGTLNPQQAQQKAKELNVTVPQTFRSEDEAKSVSHVLNNSEELIKKYMEEYPDEINGDKAKKLFSDIGYNETNVVDFDVAGGILSKMVYDRQLKQHANDETKHILFTAGGPGSGKSSATEGIKESTPYSFTFDSNLANYDRAVALIEQAKADGYEVDVVLTDRPIEKAYAEGVLQRYKEGEPRTVPIETHVNNHIGARETAVGLHDKYKDDPMVNVGVQKNHGTLDEITPVGIDFVRNQEYNKDELKEKLYEYATEQYESGAINEEQLNAILGRKATEIRAKSKEKPQQEKKQVSTSQEPLKPISDDFYIIARDLDKNGKEKISFEKVDGKPVEIESGIETFVNKNRDGKGWIVTEGRSGLRIAGGDTQKEAIELAKGAIQSFKNKGEGTLDELIKKQTDKRGLSPRYKAPEPVKTTPKKQTKEEKEREIEEARDKDQARIAKIVDSYKDKTPAEVRDASREASRSNDTFLGYKLADLFKEKMEAKDVNEFKKGNIYTDIWQDKETGKWTEKYEVVEVPVGNKPGKAKNLKTGEITKAYSHGDKRYVLASDYDRLIDGEKKEEPKITVTKAAIIPTRGGVQAVPIEKDYSDKTFYRGSHLDKIEAGEAGAVFGSTSKEVAKEYGKHIHEFKIKSGLNIKTASDRVTLANELLNTPDAISEDEILTKLGKIPTKPYNPYDEVDKLIFPILKEQDYDGVYFEEQTFDKPEIAIFTSSDIIQGNEQDSNTGAGDNTEAVSEPVSAGSSESGTSGSNDQVNGEKAVQQRSKDDSLSDDNVGNGLRTPKSRTERVNNLLAKTPAARYNINKQVEAIIDSKSSDNMFDPSVYTAEEIELMKKYSGYGGINREDTERGALDEFFTPTKAVRFTWQKLIELGLTNDTVGTIIEPAVGTGRFLTLSPFTHDKFTGYEINQYSAVVAQVLHPESNINLKNFSELFMDGRVPKKNIEPIADLVIGNPPYGKYMGLYKGMGEGKEFDTFEEYFIARGLSLTKDGGYLAYVVQSSFLRSDVTQGKMAIANMADLVAAYRLPNNVFKESGTSVGTDLVIFKKGKKNQMQTLTLGNDSYFSVNPNNILGTEIERKGKFGMEKFVEGGEENIPSATYDVVKSTPEVAPVVKKEKKTATIQDVKTQEKQLKGIFTAHKETKKKAMQITNISKIDDLELEGYKQLTTDGSLNAGFVNGLTEQDRLAHFSYKDGKWYPDKLYVDAQNLYKLLEQLEADKDVVTAAQYKKQQDFIKSNLPEWTNIKDIKIDPKHRMWSEIELEDPNSYRNGMQHVQSLFIDALWKYPNSMMEGMSKQNVIGYVTDSNVKSENDDQKRFIQNNRARVANKLFTHFLTHINETQPGAQQMIENYYNKNYNAYKVLSHEYIPITQPLNNRFLGKEWGLNKAQREAIGFLLSRGKGIPALDVGVGKTITGIITMFETFNRGWGSRAIVAVPNPGIGKQWIRTIQEIMPEANIYDVLDTSKLEKMRNIKMVDKSVLFVTEDGFEKIGLTEESFKDILPDIEEAVSGLELSARQRAQEGEKAQQIIGQSMAGTYTDLTFESLGIDMLLMDEAHNYNHIIASVPSGAKEGEKKLNPYSGLRMNPSKRGVKAYVMGKYVLKNNDDRNVFLLTATPFTNNPLEHYSMLSFVAQKELRERGVYNVREFIQSFMEMENQLVVNPAGMIVEKQVVTNFSNFDAYQQLLQSAMIKIDGEEAGVIRPDRIDKDILVKTSEPQFELSNRLSTLYMEINDQIKKTSDKEMKKKLVGERLRVMSALVANSWSPYATKYFNGKTPTAQEFVENTPKLKLTAEMIRDNLKANKEANSIVYMPFVQNETLQIQFHQLFRDYLVKNLKLKPNQVEIITGQVTKPKRLAIQKAFNEGEVKVLLGTYAIAEGLDLQVKTSDIYITAPFWNYTQFRQMAGRGWRQGNMWKQIRINRIMSEGTADVFVTQKIKEKERRDNLINRAIKEGKLAKNLEGDELEFESVLSSLLSDPVQKVEIQRSEEERKLRSEIANLDGQVQYAQRLVDPSTRAGLQGEINDFEGSQKRYKEQATQYQTEYDTIDDKESSRATYLKENITTYKSYATKAAAKARSSKQKLQILDETIAKEGITQDGLAELRNKLQEKQALLQTLTDKYNALKESAVKEKAGMRWTPTDYASLLAKREAENKEFFVPRDNKVAPSGKGRADVGGYAVKEADEVKQTVNDQGIKAVEFPEIVRMIQELSGNDIKLKNFKNALAKTYIDETNQDAFVAFNRQLWAGDEKQNIAKIGAHELGHLADALPDFNDKRGNLLGHIATLKKHLKHKYGELENKVIKDELKRLTQIWKPFDEAQSKRFTQYRYSPQELYADAISVMFNDPDLLKETAPEFWKGFFEYIDQKPEVKQTFFDTWTLLNKGEDAVLSQRLQVISESFEKAEEKWKILREEKRQEKRNYWFDFKNGFLDTNQFFIDRVKQVRKNGGIVRDDLNPEYALDSRNYLGGRLKALLERDINPIVQEIAARDLPREELGKLMLLERIIAAPERADIANPFGLDRDTATPTLDKMKRDLGEENFTFLQEKAQEVRTVFKGLLTEAYKFSMLSDELYKEVIDNPAYATFAVVDYLETHISGTIFTGTGTLKGVADPFTATVMKMMGTIWGIEYQKTKLTAVGFMKQEFKDEIKDAEYQFNGRFNEPVESKDKDWKLVKYLEKGEVKGVYIDPVAARVLEYESFDRANIALHTLKWLNNNWFRPVYITFNVGFQTFNVVRDFVRFTKNYPSRSIIKSFWDAGSGYYKALPHAINRGFDRPDTLLQEMYDSKVLTISYNDFLLGQTDQDKQLEAMLEASGIIEKPEKHKIVVQQFINLLDFIKNVGDSIESIPKIAGYQKLKGKMDNEELAHFVRNYLGSPNFLAGGTEKRWSNEMFLFSNAIAQGLRADYHIAFQNPKTRSGFWIKTALLNFTPKIIMFAALMGIFGDDLRKKFENMSEYDRTNYITVPLGNIGDKTAYIRAPQDETGRFMAGMFWKALQYGFNSKNQDTRNSIFEILSYTGGQFPSLAPVLEVLSATGQYAAGQNPYDFYRAREIIPQKEFKAGGWERFKPFATWVVQSLGGSIILGHSVTERTPSEKSWIEKGIALPVISNVLGRWVKVSNYGQVEQNRKILRIVETEQSQELLERDRQVSEAVGQFQKSDKSRESQIKIMRELILDTVGKEPETSDEREEARRILKKYTLGTIRGQNDPYINAFIDANTNDEKIALLKRMRGQLEQTEYKDLKQRMAQYNIVSEDFMKRAVSEGL